MQMALRSRGPPQLASERIGPTVPQPQASSLKGGKWLLQQMSAAPPAPSFQPETLSRELLSRLDFHDMKGFVPECGVICYAAMENEYRV